MMSKLYVANVFIMTHEYTAGKMWDFLLLPVCLETKLSRQVIPHTSLTQSMVIYRYI